MCQNLVIGVNMSRIDEKKASAMLYELSKMPLIIIGTAYLYAKNYVRYGVDVTKAWDTATEQTVALDIAYHMGICDAECRRNNGGVV